MKKLICGKNKELKEILVNAGGNRLSIFALQNSNLVNTPINSSIRSESQGNTIRTLDIFRG